MHCIIYGSRKNSVIKEISAFVNLSKVVIIIFYFDTHIHKSIRWCEEHENLIPPALYITIFKNIFDPDFECVFCIFGSSKFLHYIPGNTVQKFQLPGITCRKFDEPII